LKKVGERRRLLRYLELDNPESYKKIIETLKLKPTNRLQREEEIKKILDAEVAGEEITPEVAAKSEVEEKI
jgi:hypothetical protein